MNALTESDSLGFRVAFAYNPDAPSPLYRITGYEKTQDITPPVISLHGGGEVELEYGTPYEEAGYDATDPEEGDLTTRVEVSGSINVYEQGTYFKRYNVADSAGNNATEVIRTIKVKAENKPKLGDDIPPIITLIGEASITINQGDEWDELGAIAIDNQDGTISEMISISGIVDFETPGAYYIKYNVTDSSGNWAIEKIRTVRVTGIIQEFNLTVMQEGMGSFIGNSSGVYPKDYEISITANPSDGYSFDKWTGDLNSDKKSVTFMMDTNKVITAIFTKDKSTQVLDNQLLGGLDITNGWKKLDWFGHFFPTSNNWLYHKNHGWLFPVKGTNDNFWFYDTTLGWFWTGPNFYIEAYFSQKQFIYSDKYSEWLFFKKQNDKRTFYLYSISRWINPDGSWFSDN